MNSIEQPKWKIPEYTRSQINKAGDALRNPNTTEEEKADSLKIVDNWRAAHAYPLHVFYMNLKHKAEASEKNIIVVERLKRLKSIIDKLNRESGMQLYRMQDIGGCRMVVPKINDVYEFSDKMRSSQIRHKLVKENDYIISPKGSGYRSLHLVYRFYTDTYEKKIYNDYPMLIELQFRTHLQHIWATAVETIGLMLNQPLKAGIGKKEFLRFFKLVSSIFALREGCNIVPDTSTDETELISEIRELNAEYKILDFIQAIRVALENEVNIETDKRGYYILKLDYSEKVVEITFFKPSELEEANKTYDRLENENKEKPLNVVMVRASSYASVKAAYPNYFLDIGEFIKLVKQYIE